MTRLQSLFALVVFMLIAYLQPAYGVPSSPAVPDVAPSEMESFTDVATGLQISYPKSWSVEKPSDGLRIVRFKPAYPGITICISRQNLGKKMSVKSYTHSINALEVKNGAAKRWKVKVLESKSSGTVCSLPSFTSKLAYTMPPPVKSSMVTQVTVMKGTIGYTFDLMAVTALHEAYAPTFNDMVKSIKIK